MSEREQRAVAPWGEHVFEGEGEQNLLAGMKVTAALILAGSCGDDDRDVLLVEHVHAGDGILHVDHELDERLERDPLALWQRCLTFAVLVLDPRLDHARIAVATALAYGAANRLRVASEVDLQVAVGHLVWLSKMNHRATLE